MTKNRTPTPVYLDPGMHPGLEVKGLIDSIPHPSPHPLISTISSVRFFNNMNIFSDLTKLDVVDTNSHNLISKRYHKDVDINY